MELVLSEWLTRQDRVGSFTITHDPPALVIRHAHTVDLKDAAEIAQLFVDILNLQDGVVLGYSYNSGEDAFSPADTYGGGGIMILPGLKAQNMMSNFDGLIMAQGTLEGVREFNKEMEGL